MRWYLGVRCRKCHKPILFALDRTEGSGGEETVSAGKLVLTCTLDKCRHQADYSGAAVSRFQRKRSPADNRRNDESGKGRKHKR
jgi:hypothetical protein